MLTTLGSQRRRQPRRLLLLRPLRRPLSRGGAAEIEPKLRLNTKLRKLLLSLVARAVDLNASDALLLILKLRRDLSARIRRELLVRRQTRLAANASDALEPKPKTGSQSL